MFRTNWMIFAAALTLMACANDVGLDGKTEPGDIAVEGAQLGGADSANNPYRGELAYGATVHGDLTTSMPVHYWSFQGTAGDAVFIDLANRAGSDTFLSLYVEDGAGWALVDYNDDCRGSLNSCLEIVLGETGRYLVGATSYRYAALGRPTRMSYDLTVHCNNESGVCGAPAEQACGSRGLGPCPEGQYCDWEEREICGRADGAGVCRAIPEIHLCTRIVDPIEVCGCDGTTYATECFAAANGVSVLHQGACEPLGQGVGETCGGIAALQCDTGLRCDYSANVGCDIADVAGVCAEVTEVICIALYRPECGCDGVTYSNDCHRRGAGVALAYSGECR